MKNNYLPRQYIHISSSAARSTHIPSQESNAFVTQNSKTTKLNTLLTCQT